MLRLLVSFVVSLLFLALPARAQTLEGRVTDAETGAPLAGANVFVPALQTGTATDEDGRYRLDLGRPGTYRILYRFLGFQSETYTVTLAEGVTRLDVALHPTAIETAPITVTAKAQASDILSTPQAVSVVEGAELARLRGTSAFDALEATAGVRLLRTGPGLAKPMVRGLTSQRVVVVQNGIRQEGQQWGDEHAPELDAFDVERLEVVKGPASLLYGSDALGGVVHATSGDLFEARRPLEGTVGLQAMSNTRQGAGHARLGGRQGAYAYEGTLTLRRAGNYETPDGVVPNTGLEETSAALRLGRTLAGGGHLVAAYQRFDARLALFEPEEHAGDEEPLAEPGRYDINLPYQSVEHDRLRLALEHRFDLHRFEFDAAWQQNRRKEFEEHDEEVGGKTRSLLTEAAGDPALFLRLNTVTADARFHHRPIGRMYGTFGVSGFFQKNETLAEETLIPGATTWDAAAYVTEEWLLDRLTVSAGLRYDHRRLAVEDNADLGVTAQTRTYDALSGAVGLAWQPATGLSLAFNAGRAWRAPALIELFGNGVHEGTIRFERGRADLDIEQSLSLDATVRWLTRHLYVEATGYLNHIDGYIFPRRTDAVDPESGYFIYQYDQADARLWGLELRADLHPHPLDVLHLHLSGDLARARNLDTDTWLPFTPPARVRIEAALEREAAGPFHDVELRLGPVLVARQDRVDENELPTDGYTVWNLSLGAVAEAGGVTLRPLLAVDNLFDTAYLDHLSRYRPFGVLAPGRNVRFQLGVSF
ncbi:MAG: TonB-dependent receptor [Rhodothermaceae bacterium]|nr:MAG: TonB-dependent receptor [Rhodothermaceae bacterium]